LKENTYNAKRFTTLSPENAQALLSSGIVMLVLVVLSDKHVSKFLNQ
jgi:hypothetical protein